jgi:hypothetical protein
MYNANVFPLIKYEPLPVYRYNATVNPKPATRPQLYQILGLIAKKIMYEEKWPVVAIGQEINSISCPISKLRSYTAEIPEVGKFDVELTNVGDSVISVEQFDDYRHLINRLADVALTVFSNEYHKFHPEAPYIFRDEPYFDEDLIERIGIIDSKAYYRGLHEFNGRPVFVLNRETQLRSNKNLLNEMKRIKKHFELSNKLTLDFYKPPKEFQDYVNFIFMGKTADVLPYPGPNVRRIKAITWAYRAKDITPGSTKSHIQYLRETYGITNLDADQPLVVYEIEERKRIQYHVPEVLSVGHTFRDLEKLIPPWQRTQVWGIIHPDCKNQLQKIYEVLLEIDDALRKNLHEVYPRLVEFSTEALDVSSFVSQPVELKLQFRDRVIQVNPPYDAEFYHSYSNKKVIFAKTIGPIRALVCLQKKSRKIETFLDALAKEFRLRNDSELTFDYSVLDLARTDYSGYQILITIGDDSTNGEESYRKCKEVLQNELGIIHQHVTEEHADEDSVMAMVMELNLKLGGDPWLLPEQDDIVCVVGIHSYLNPFSERKWIFAIALGGNGKLVKQFEPIEPADFDELCGKLAELNKSKHRVLYVLSYDRFGIFEKLKDFLGQTPDIEYCIAEIDNQDYLRFFETWLPRKAPRFGRAATEVVKSPIEAYELAPQGVALKSDENTFFLLTGKTIEKGMAKRGCPAPVRLAVLEKRGDNWDNSEIVNYVFAMCMMGRASGHMTSFPAPLYYLKLYAHYCNDFGVPMNEQVKQRIFYV